MNTRLTEIQDLLNTKSELEAYLALIPYDGTPEVKEAAGRKYISIRKRVHGRLSSRYVGPYSETLYDRLLVNARLARDLKARIRKTDAKLSALGYIFQKPSPSVIKNVEFAHVEINRLIYSQAVLEGVDASFEDAEPVLDNGLVNNLRAGDVRKIMNLKNAWEFILSDSVVTRATDLSLVSYIARLVNDGFYHDGGRLRGVPADPVIYEYAPPLPDPATVENDLASIASHDAGTDAEKAAGICLYIIRNVLFYDGNKRTAILAANHFLISRGAGILAVPPERAEEFRKLLASFRKGRGMAAIRKFLIECVEEPVG